MYYEKLLKCILNTHNNYYSFISGILIAIFLFIYIMVQKLNNAISMNQVIVC